MLLAGTLLVKNEIDIIRPWMEFHRHRFDMLYVTDNGSMDGTREYLAGLDGVTVIDEPAQDYRQHVWVDRMIRLAIEAGADWVVNSDADEFWIGDIGAEIERHTRENVLSVRSWTYRPTEADDPNEENPVRRMTYRDREFEARFTKVIHATARYKDIFLGNHDVFFHGEKRVAPADGLRIAHYTVRDWEHFARKIITGGEAYTRSTLPKNYGYHWRGPYSVYEAGGIEALRQLYEREFLLAEGDLWKLERDPILP